MGRVFDAIVIVLYPLLVMLGLTYLNVRWTALLILLLIGRRFVVLVFTNKDTSIPVIIQIVLTACLFGGTAASESELMLRFIPFGISIIIFAQFALSLRTTPIIERFARLQRPDLPHAHVLYCKTLTKVWLLILAGNSLIVISAAFIESKFIWAFIVGPMSYFYLGIFFAGEYIFRKHHFQDFNDKNPIDKMLKPLLKKNTGKP